MHTDTAQEFVRAIFNEQQRLGARQHKQAQRDGRLRAELKAARAEVVKLKAQAETVQVEAAAVFERLRYAVTGKSDTPGPSFVHWLFENWTAAWQGLADQATDLRTGTAPPRDAH